MALRLCVVHAHKRLASRCLFVRCLFNGACLLSCCTACRKWLGFRAARAGVIRCAKCVTTVVPAKQLVVVSVASFQAVRPTSTRPARRIHYTKP